MSLLFGKQKIIVPPLAAHPAPAGNLNSAQHRAVHTAQALLGGQLLPLPPPVGDDGLRVVAHTATSSGSSVGNSSHEHPNTTGMPDACGAHAGRAWS